MTNALIKMTLISFLAFSVQSQASWFDCQTSLAFAGKTGIYEATVTGTLVKNELHATSMVVKSFAPSDKRKVEATILKDTTNVSSTATIEDCDGDCTASRFDTADGDASLLVLTEANTDGSYTSYLTVQSKGIYREFLQCSRSN
jgi:hypothetical protein